MARALQRRVPDSGKDLGLISWQLTFEGCNPMEGQGQNELVILKGLLIPTNWDEKGRAVGFALSGFDEKIYQLDDPKGFKRFQELLRKVVSVRGTLTQTSDGSQILRVRNYESTQGEIEDEKKR